MHLSANKIVKIKDKIICTQVQVYFTKVQYFFLYLNVNEILVISCR
jgi:hypothetical protein